MKPSLQSKIITFVLKSINFRKIIEKKISKPIARPKKEFVPGRIKRAFSLNSIKIQNKTIATFERKEKVTNLHIVYFHGGAYIFNATSGNWKFAEKIVRKCSCRMTMVDYPLAPEHNYKDTFSMLKETYDHLTRQYEEDQFILMGDSAGGGLALAFAQKLIIENHQKLPAKMILLSPWLDLTMSNPSLKNFEKSDYMLTLKMLKSAGLKYSDRDRLDNYLLSPINGDFKNLPKTLVFFGSEELFKADCLKLKSMAQPVNKDMVFNEYQKMQHDWIVFPIPERDQVINQICLFIDDKNVL